MALKDQDWAEQSRNSLAQDATRLDQIMNKIGARPMGDCPLFRTYDVANAHDLQHQLAKSHIWTRIFPSRDRWIRLGLPPTSDLQRREAAL